MESFLGHMIAGGVFCLFGGQPLTVLGCTGPVSFQYHMHKFCNGFVNSTSTLFVFCRCSSLRRSLLNSVTAMVSWKHSNLVSTPSTGIYYLTMRLWIGLWASFFCMIIVAVDGSAIVRYFTRWDVGDSPKIDQTRFFCVRFTEEAFAALVGIIFIKESLSKLFSKFPGLRYFILKHLSISQRWERRSRCTWTSTSTRSLQKSIVVVARPMIPSSTS